VQPEEIKSLELSAVKDFIRQRVRAAYEDKEVSYPVMAGLHHFTTRDSNGQKRYDRDALVGWARDRFQVELNVDDLRNLQRDEVQAMLVQHSRKFQQQAGEAHAEADKQLEHVFPATVADDVPAGRAGSNGSLDSLATWLHDSLWSKLTVEKLSTLNRQQLGTQLHLAVEDRYRPEIRRMERTLMLEILDTAWKDHLLAMDHLRSSVGLRGYAQVDPKVEYKREGMRTYELMWQGVYERVTELIFRMEQLNEDFVGSVWTETAAIHEEAGPSIQLSDTQQQQQAAIEGSDAKPKMEPIRNRQEKVGRNDPCPCGSGKKFKNCHMRKGAA
jgi:preprotein translocase subunit SecA